MSEPFTGSIVGSWLFIRSTKSDFETRIIHHFTAGGKSYWEMDFDGKRILTSTKYRFAGNTLTVIFSSGAESDFALTAEDDGSVMVPNPNGILWWMVRLSAREPYSKAFVDEHGELQKLNPA